MSVIVKPQVMIERKSESTSTPDLRFLWDDFNFECASDEGLGSDTISAAVEDEVLWTGSNPNTFILYADGDVSIKYGNTSATPVIGKFFMNIFSDADGPAVIYIGNTGESDVSIKYFISEGLVTT